VATALGNGGGWLGPDEVASLLGCYGLPLAEQRAVATAIEAGEVAAALGGEVVLKAVAPGLIHKSDQGAVRLGLRGADAVTRAAREMADGLTAAGQPPTGFLVQRMVSGGVEMIVGLIQDPSFGPVLACGAGGVMAEILHDVSVRLTPLTEPDLVEMPRELRTYPLLQGYRGAPPNDIAALEDVLRRVGALAEDLPQVVELDCNPVKVLEHGACIVDARIQLASVEAPRPLSARR
jgi:acyl-CoA synthetase (NDP forming)